MVSLVARNTEQAADASVAAVFRSIEKYRSTLLFDEVDTIFRARNEDAADFRRILNSGYRIGGGALRTHGENHEPTKFSTFSPKLLAGIGSLPDTLESRSVAITMQKRLPHEQADRLRLRVVRPEADQLSERIGDVAARAIPELAGAFPEIPDELGDRAADCAEPLLAIADYAGGTWPADARNRSWRSREARASRTSQSARGCSTTYARCSVSATGSRRRNCFRGCTISRRHPRRTGSGGP